MKSKNLKKTKTSKMQRTQGELGRLAKAWADILYKDYAHHRRGAVNIGQGYRVLFGNDGYRGDDRAQTHVRFLRSELQYRGIKDEGFGVGPNGCTWALIVKHPRTAELDRLDSECWFAACGWEAAKIEEFMAA